MGEETRNRCVSALDLMIEHIDIQEGNFKKTQHCIVDDDFLLLHVNHPSQLKYKNV
jgi:hypothetical protein